MSTPSTRGPGSNQHQDKAPVTPRTATASAPQAGVAVADPLDAPAADRPLRHLIEAGDLHDLHDIAVERVAAAKTRLTDAMGRGEVSFDLLADVERAEAGAEVAEQLKWSTRSDNPRAPVITLLRETGKVLSGPAPSDQAATHRLEGRRAVLASAVDLTLGQLTSQ